MFLHLFFPLTIQKLFVVVPGSPEPGKHRGAMDGRGQVIGWFYSKARVWHKKIKKLTAAATAVMSLFQPLHFLDVPDTFKEAI